MVFRKYILVELPLCIYTSWLFSMANHYDIPKWAGKPPVGLHLDVLKGDKLVQKLMVDEKKCYLFGRNPELNDFCIDHASCSRVHAAMVYHKHLNRAFLVDLGSTHGTYIGSIRLEGNKPMQLPVDSLFHFGASTRMYILRERPQAVQKTLLDDKVGDEVESGLLSLPETEIELDNLTEFNTAHNRRISMLGIVDEDVRPVNHKRKRKLVSFNEDEEVINPEDIDPSVGRFRNLIQTAVIPTKRKKIDGGLGLNDSHDMMGRRVQPLNFRDGLYGDLPRPGNDSSLASTSHLYSMTNSISSKMGLSLPNPAPDVDNVVTEVELLPPVVVPMPLEPISLEPRKKKYAKEAWPGKKPAPSLLM